MILYGLNFQKNIMDKLNDINSIEKLYKINEKELKNLGFTYLIAIKLQLNGLS